jgi:hypothetical protein
VTERSGAGKRIVEEFSAVGFVRELEGLPLVEQLLRVLDRFM